MWMMEEKNRFKELLRKFEEFVFGVEREERDIQHYQLIVAIEDALTEDYVFPWIIDFMHNRNDSYAVFADGGKLFKATYSLDGQDDVTIENVTEVKLAYPEVENSISTKIFRSKEGELRWIAIASAAVLNRVGEIDSTALFDSFEENFSEEELPYLTLQHLPEEFAFGEIRGVFRHNSLLIAFGSIDESTVLGQNAEAQFSTGEWGMSIGFRALEMPEIIELGGVNIPVYKKGKLVEISVLKEDRAASHFTNILGVNEERLRMAKDRDAAKELLLEFAGENSEDEVDELLDEANLRERKIKEDGLITRDADAEDVEDAEEETTETEEDVETNEGETETEESSEEASNDNSDLEIEIDEEIMEKISNAVAERVMAIIQPKFDEMEERLAENKRDLQEQVTELRELYSRANEILESNTERLVEVEKSDEERLKEAKDDLPSSENRKLTIRHRPSGKVEPEKGQKEQYSSIRDVANETLEKINSRNK
jgi:hypothetical protein